MFTFHNHGRHGLQRFKLTDGTIVIFVALDASIFGAFGLQAWGTIVVVVYIMALTSMVALVALLASTFKEISAKLLVANHVLIEF